MPLGMACNPVSDRRRGTVLRDRRYEIPCGSAAPVGDPVHAVTLADPRISR